MDEVRWYANGLQFECTQCGKCCTGTPGYVWVNQEELAALAAAIGQDVEAFEQTYVRKVGTRKSLREFPDGACVFLDTEQRRCSVYTVRPRQCRTWPFWDSNVRTPADWERTCQECPGSGRGRLYNLEEIEATRQVMRI